LIDHILVPKHEIINSEEAEEVLVKYKATREQLPKILFDDPAIKDMKPNAGDIVKITRHSESIGVSIYYRVVTE